MKDRKLSQCCSVSICWEPIALIGTVPAKHTFARAPVCSACAKIVGDYQLLYGAHSAVTRKMNGTSWLLMVDERMRRPGTPFNFVERDGRYIPEGYTGELKAQPDLTEDVPF